MNVYFIQLLILINYCKDTKRTIRFQSSYVLDKKFFKVELIEIERNGVGKTHPGSPIQPIQQSNYSLQYLLMFENISKFKKIMGSSHKPKILMTSHSKPEILVINHSNNGYIQWTFGAKNPLGCDHDPACGLCENPEAPTEATKNL